MVGGDPLSEILAPPADRNPAGPRPLAGLGSEATESGSAAQRQAPDLLLAVFPRNAG